MTSENSVPFRLGDVVVRIPDAFLFNPESADRLHAKEVQALTLVFWYPDMTPGYLLNDPAPTRPPSAHSVGVVPHSPYEIVAPTPSLKIYVAWFTYSSDDKRMRSPRPPEILENLANGEGGPDLFPTSYPGLRALSYLRFVQKAHPNWNLNINPAARTYSYIQTADRPYEVYLHCSSACSFDLYSPTTHLQMEGTIYGGNDEVAPEADAIMQTLNRLMTAWTSPGVAARPARAAL
jgi:hypothetical protein